MWLIQEDVLRDLRAVDALTVTPSRAMVERFEAMASESPTAAGNRIRGGKGETAELNVTGILTERPSLIAMMLGVGGTSYQAIRGALAQIDADPEVSSLVMHMSSPGGHVDGLFETIAAIQAFSKPITVRASNAQSAAYALAAAAGPIEATSVAATFGSIGIVAGVSLDDKLIQITNTESPHKRPDVTTAEGKGIVREHLDALHELFVSAIAEGRSHHAGDAVTPALVSKSFGRGATVLAGEAKRLKMIDRLPSAIRRGGSRVLAFAGMPDSQGNLMTSEPTLISKTEMTAAANPKRDFGDEVAEIYMRDFAKQKAAAEPEQPSGDGKTDFGDEVAAEYVRHFQKAAY